MNFFKSRKALQLIELLRLQNESLVIENEALKEKNRISERALQDVKHNSNVSRANWLRHRPFENFNFDFAVGLGSDFGDDQELAERLIQSYRYASDQRSEASTWTLFFNLHHQKIHEAFLHGEVDEVLGIVANPASNNLFYGFDELCSEFILNFQKNPKPLLDICQDDLFRLAEAIGKLNLWNPEGGDPPTDLNMNTDEILLLIEDGLGLSLEFPDIYKGGVGLNSKRGVITYRAIHAIYLAYRLSQLLKVNQKEGGSVCEIGAGLGRSAYYAYKMGIKNYTIVDIPVTLMSQAFYLMKCLGAEKVNLPGEGTGNKDQIKLMFPEEFFASKEVYNIIANQDSLTELGVELGKKYLLEISNRSNLFLSINHEVNSFTINKLGKDIFGKFSIARYPYWMRHGYAEELINFN